MKHFDKFTDGKFNGSQWSAPRLNTVEEVEQALDEFQLVGRTIRSIQTVGISFAHRMDEIDEYAHQLIQQLPEDQKQEKEGFDDLEPEMEMETEPETVRETEPATEMEPETEPATVTVTAMEPATEVIQMIIKTIKMIKTTRMMPRNIL